MTPGVPGGRPGPRARRPAGGALGEAPPGSDRPAGTTGLRRAWLERADAAFPVWSLLPAVAVLVALTVYPVLNLFRISVSTVTFSDGAEHLAFDPRANYELLISDPILPPTVRNTLVFVLVSVTAAMVIGTALAIVVARIPRGKGLVRTAMILPILIPPVAIGSMWRLIYNYEFGVLNQLLALFALGPVDWLGSQHLALVSVIAVDVWHWVPFIFLILFAAVEGLPPDVLEAARVDGARQFQVTRYIILPLLMPAIAVAFLFRAVLAFKAFDEVFLLTSGGPGTATELISLHLYRVFFEQNQMGYGAMLSITVILMVAAFLLVARRAARGAGRA